jgi:hypothetical protein
LEISIIIIKKEIEMMIIMKNEEDHVEEERFVESQTSVIIQEKDFTLAEVMCIKEREVLMKKNHTEKTQQESYSDKSFILIRGKGARQATVNDGSHTHEVGRKEESGRTK